MSSPYNPRHVPGCMLLNICPLILLWGDFLRIFTREWQLNPDYHYGYLVPLISAYLIYLRWQHRPQPPDGKEAKLWRPALYAQFALLALWLPIRIIIEANPDWRAAQWALAVDLVAFTLALFGTWGGPRWIRHFAVPVSILLLAVPWPVNFEQALIAQLMHTVAGFTVELLNLLGIFAERHGNIIRVATGLVGIEQACSGVRSLQSTLMAAIFLGELYRFRITGRMVLLVAGIILSFTLNVARTLTLTLAAAERSPGIVDYLHDPVGNIISILAFLILLAGATAARSRTPGATAATTGLAPQPCLMPIRLAATITCLTLALFIINWLWYARSTPAPAHLNHLQMDWAQIEAKIHPEPIPDITRGILRYTHGERMTWTPQPGLTFTAFFFTWEENHISSLSNVHRPEVCLPSAGLQQTGTEETYTYTHGDITLTFATHTFTNGPTRYYSYYTHWGTTSGNTTTPADSTSWATRLQNAIHARKIHSRQSLQIIATGPAAPQISQQHLQHTLDQALTLK